MKSIRSCLPSEALRPICNCPGLIESMTEKSKAPRARILEYGVSIFNFGSFMPTEEILAWMKQQNDEVVSNIKQIPISELKGWSYRDDRIRHDSGKFFSIDGIHIETNYRDVSQWDQPIINQPEIGFLGFIVNLPFQVVETPANRNISEFPSNSFSSVSDSA